MKYEWRAILLKILLVKVAVVALGTSIYLFTSVPKRDISSVEGFVHLWYRYDALRYIEMVETGYSDKVNGIVRNIPFFPAFPWSIRWTDVLIGNPEISGFLLGHLFSIAGFLMFYALARVDLDARRARDSLWAYMLFPASYFFHLPYSEGLFLIGAAGSFYAARRGHWWAVGLLGVLAGVTRSAGLCLFPALLTEFYLQRREKRIGWENLFWVFTVLGGFGLYLLINKVATGEFFGFLQSYSTYWSKKLTWPWTAFIESMKLIVALPYGDMWINKGVMEIAAAFFLIVATIRSFSSDRLSYAVYIGSATVFFLSTATLESTPRYILSAFPVFFLSGPVNWRSPLSWLLAGLMVFLMTIYLWRYLFGWWAF